MLFAMINLVLTKSSGPKCHAVEFTAPFFAGFYVRHTDLSGGAGAGETGLCWKKLGGHERWYTLCGEVLRL